MHVAAEIDRALAHLAPISLAEMDSVALLDRVDNKYVMSDALLPQLLDALRTTYRVLEVEGYRKSPYSSLYFDTTERVCYHDHHNGRANRRKYRKRTYLASGKTFFEIKLKNNRERTVKQRIVLPGLEPTYDDLSAALVHSQVPNLGALSPLVWTNFSRITLVGKHIPERATIDVGLTFRDSRQEISLPGAVILEVKQQRSTLDSPFRQQLREMRIAPLRVSKYCVASALLNPSLKRNRFKMKLQALHHCSH